MQLTVQSPVKSLNKAYFKEKVSRNNIEKFKQNLIILFDKVQAGYSEDTLKDYITEFLRNTWYNPDHAITINKERKDLTIHTGKTAKDPVTVIAEIKKIDSPEIRQPHNNFLIIPRVSSERRKYIPFGLLPKDIIVNDLVSIIPDANFYQFGILSSIMHVTWVKHVAGRLKSDFRYSKDIVYNNYPWPENPTEKQKKAVEEAAQAVLEARASFPDSSLADLYDPNTMPPVLVKAH